MPTLHLILIVAAFVLFLIAAMGIPSSRINLIALGLALVTLTLLV